MKRKIMGILLGLVVLCHPVHSWAYERQCPHPIEVTYTEAQELMQVAASEALNQGPDGMRLVMSVVLNRVNSPEFPNNIHDVIHQPHQFATSRMGKVDITPEVHEALCEIEMGNVTPEIVAFETTTNSALDVYYSKAFDYKDHSFYTLMR